MLHALKEPHKKALEEILYKRMRIPIKSIYRNEMMAAKLNNYVSSIKGVHYSKANPLTGKILILFNEEITNENRIEKQIDTYIKRTPIVHESDVMPINKTAYKEEIASSIEAIQGAVPDMGYTNEKLYYHALDKRKIESMLKTDYRLGLTRKEAHEKSKVVGLNVLSEKKRKSLLASFFENLNDFSTKLLLGVGGISFFLGQIPEAIAILGIVFIQTALGTAQQHRAENSLYSLKDMLVHKARVIRSGKEQEIEAKYLVPGDIIVVEAGDKVPADARIIECNDLTTTEASLTGESTPVIKSMESCSHDAELGSRHNLLFMGTNIVTGRGRAVVVATGINTEIGKIASMLQNIKVEPTPLQNKIENFTNKLIKAGIGLFFAVSGIGLLSGKGLGEVLTMGVSLTLGAIPESLPIVVTTTMALSVQRLAKRNAIVRKITAVENLGSANVICCDKTGTLTMNEMTVRKMYTDGCLYNVSGSGYKPTGTITLMEGNPARRSALKELLKAGVLCNNACLIQVEDKWDVQGDPTEGALLTAAHKMNLDVEDIKQTHTRMKEIPFDSSKCFMTVMVDTEKGKFAYCKGALDRIMDKCKTIYENGEERLFTSTDREKIQSICDEMAEDALRVLGFAYKKIDKENTDIEAEENFVFLGLIGMEDPPREGVKKSIQKCFKAGIKVVMITGDHAKTAGAIGRQLGLFTDGLVVSGSDLENMSDEELDARIDKIQVFARTSPEQKHRIVKAFKRSGFIVAMTGDGVNDAPAIKEANIGIAMGGNGSDVAKDAAAITLVDDDFSTIVRAIEEGRSVSKNIRNAMKYLITGNLGEMLAITLTSVVSGASLLLPIQILWINVISETLMGFSFATETPAENVMDSPPIKKDAPLIDRKLGSQIIRRGAGIGLTTFAVFEGALFLGAGVSKARTLAFANLICAQMANAYDCRSNKKVLSNRYLNTITAASAVLLLGIMYVPFMSAFFGTAPLLPLDWAALLGTTALSRI